MYGKLINAGQTCVAPDYVLVPKQDHRPVHRCLPRGDPDFYPTLATNPQYTSIINDRQFRRLAACVEDARAQAPPCTRCTRSRPTRSAGA